MSGERTATGRPGILPMMFPLPVRRAVFFIVAAMAVVLGGMRPASALTACVPLGFTGPAQLDFASVLSNCRAGKCPPRFIVEDARFDDLLFGTTPITAVSIRRFADTSRVPPYVSRADAALREHAYRRAFAAYSGELRAAISLTRQQEFAAGPELQALDAVLARGALAPLDIPREQVLNQLCAAHINNKELRLYAAVDRLEHRDPRTAIALLVSIPYRSPPIPERHYIGLDNASLRQALDISPHIAVEALRAIRARLVHQHREQQRESAR